MEKLSYNKNHEVEIEIWQNLQLAVQRLPLAGNWPTQILLYLEFHCNPHCIHETCPDSCPPHLFLS